MYERLDLTGIRLDQVLTGNRGRVEALNTARRLGYPQRTVTPALTRWSRIYVIQVGGDLHAGTVSLAGRDGAAVTVGLPPDFRYREAPPGQLADVLAAIKAGYPDASLTAALAEALATVLDVAARARQRARTVPVEAIEEAVTVPLRPVPGLVDHHRALAPIPVFDPPQRRTVMPVTPPGTGQPPDESLVAVCAATYIADRVPAFAFVFRVPSTDSRFTVHTRTKDRYLVGETYPLVLAEPDTLPLSLSLDDWDFLRHCLHNAARHWREAIEQATAGAEQPQQDQPAEPGYLNVEPTPAGYQAAAHLFADELARVEQLNARLGDFLHPVQTAGQDGDRS